MMFLFAGASHRLQERNVPATQTSVLLNDLQPGTTYLLRVVAENDVGRGESSEPFKLRTEEEGIGAILRCFLSHMLSLKGIVPKLLEICL